MDPNTTLAELRGLVLSILPRHHSSNANRLAELFESLDEWLSKGGTPPDAWMKVRAEQYGAGFDVTHKMFNDPKVCGDCGGPIDGPHPLCDARATKV